MHIKPKKQDFNKVENGSVPVQDLLPLALLGGQRELVDGEARARAQFAQHVLDVEHEGRLPEVGVHHLARRLQAHRRVQVWLEHNTQPLGTRALDS